jgi:DNA-binding PadR family transcriptional regulator
MPEAPAAAQKPLTPSVFQILLALAGDEMHGYAIMRQVSESSGGQVKLGPGTLYYSIQRMLDKGIIAEAEERPAPDADDERRIYYRITETGRHVAATESRRLADLVKLARDRDFLRDES